MKSLTFALILVAVMVASTFANLANPADLTVFWRTCGLSFGGGYENLASANASSRWVLNNFHDNMVVVDTVVTSDGRDSVVVSTVITKSGFIMAGWDGEDVYVENGLAINVGDKFSLGLDNTFYPGAIYSAFYPDFHTNYKGVGLGLGFEIPVRRMDHEGDEMGVGARVELLGGNLTLYGTSRLSGDCPKVGVSWTIGPDWMPTIEVAYSEAKSWLRMSHDIFWGLNLEARLAFPQDGPDRTATLGLAFYK